MNSAAVLKKIDELRKKGSRHTCPGCGIEIIGGWVSPDGDKRCSGCVRKSINDRARRKKIEGTGIPGLYTINHAESIKIADERFPDYDIYGKWPERCVELVKSKVPGPRSLCIYGSTGTGKSTIAAKIAVSLYNKGLTSNRWFFERQITAEEMGNYDNKDVFDGAVNAQVLVIDDLFSAAGSDVVVSRKISVIEDLIELRYCNPTKITIMTTRRILGPKMAKSIAGKLAIRRLGDDGRDQERLEAMTDEIWQEMEPELIKSIAESTYSRIITGLVVYTGQRDRRILNPSDL